MPLPAPRTWTDGEDPINIPTADDLNLDWKDSFNFFLGNTRPILFLESNVGQALAVDTFVNINWQLETIKRGGMTHSTNASSFTVPYTGQYAGFFFCSATGLSTASTRLVALLGRGVTSLARVDQPAQITGGHEIHGSFTVDAVANDSFFINFKLTAATGTTGSGGTNRPKMLMYYVGDYS